VDGTYDHPLVFMPIMGQICGRIHLYPDEVDVPLGWGFYSIKAFSAHFVYVLSVFFSLRKKIHSNSSRNSSVIRVTVLINARKWIF
jgi:hypothetical protein